MLHLPSVWQHTLYRNSSLLVPFCCCSLILTTSKGVTMIKASVIPAANPAPALLKLDKFPSCMVRARVRQTSHTRHRWGRAWGRVQANRSSSNVLAVLYCILMGRTCTGIRPAEWGIFQHIQGLSNPGDMFSLSLCVLAYIIKKFCQICCFVAWVHACTRICVY